MEPAAPFGAVFEGEGAGDEAAGFVGAGAGGDQAPGEVFHDVDLVGGELEGGLVGVDGFVVLAAGFEDRAEVVEGFVAGRFEAGG